MLRSALLTACLCACAPLDPGAPDLPTADVEPVARAFALVQPDQALALLEDPELWLPADAVCPALFVADDGREVWQGGCALTDGTRILGALERFRDAEGAWVAGTGFEVIGPDGELLALLDGAVELVSYGELLGIGASYTGCGPARACALGVPTVDLALTLFPWSGWPRRYDLTADGVVAGPDLAPTAVYGAWSVERAGCPDEPTSGSLSIAGAAPWSLDFDGALTCDGCAALGFEGLPAGPACAAWLD